MLSELACVRVRDLLRLGEARGRAHDVSQGLVENAAMISGGSQSAFKDSPARGHIDPTAAAWAAQLSGIVVSVRRAGVQSPINRVPLAVLPISAGSSMPTSGPAASEHMAAAAQEMLSPRRSTGQFSPSEMRAAAAASTGAESERVRRPTAQRLFLVDEGPPDSPRAKRAREQ
jgi:hypothetical protein